MLVGARARKVVDWTITQILTAAVILCLVSGYVGWRLRRIGEASRREAIEANGQEFVKAAHVARDRARDELHALEHRMAELRREHAGCDARTEALVVERDELRADAEQRLVEMEEQRSTIRARELTIREAEARCAAADRDLRGVSGELDETSRESVALRDELERLRREHAGCAGREEEWRTRVAELESVAAGDRKAPKAATNGKDDLTRIRGIGPVIENDLNRLGILHYRQLAEMSAEEIDWVASQLKGFPGRIKRERWVAQARRLAKQKRA